MLWLPNGSASIRLAGLMRVQNLFFVGLLAMTAVALADMEPLVRVVDLNEGEVRDVKLCDGQTVTVRLLSVDEVRCKLRDAVRESVVTVEVDGLRARVPCALYRLPRTVGRVDIDCPVTLGYTKGSSKKNAWALDKDARLRLWPAGSPRFRKGTMGYPVGQRWFASDTQMANEPCFVNACDVPGQKKVYYHYGLDFGGAEGLVPVLAATDGTVVSRSGKLCDGSLPPLVKPRHDVVYIRDARGWYYRYSHLKSIDPAVVLGGQVKLGQKIGILGKEGGSGGWSHLHFDISMPQPSGRYGITDGYAFIWQAYVEQHAPKLVAVARPHRVAWVGEPVVLDGSASWHKDGAQAIERCEWVFGDGTRVAGMSVTNRYALPGHYTEELRIVDCRGLVARDCGVVQVFDRENPLPVPPAIHAVYWPTSGLRAGDKVTFKVRTFGVRADEGKETWDFGDGALFATTRSDGNANHHNPSGYAVTTHRYERAGVYRVSVWRKNDRGHVATARLLVQVGKDSSP